MPNPQTTEGYHAWRLAPEQFNPREVAFAEQWNEDNRLSDLIGALICFELDPNPNGSVKMPGYEGLRKARGIAESERRCAATVIQWLGSNVGFCFLEMALNRVGLKIVPASDKTR